MYDLVSVIVPIYNAEKTLELCVESIINQTYRKLEIILVNDGSLDNSLNICNSYKKVDRRIIVINQINKGEGAARNAGLEVCSGKYVTFLDSDDELPSNSIATLTENFDCQLVIGGLKKRTKKSEKIYYPYPKKVKGKIEISNVITDPKYIYFINCIASKLFLNDVIITNKLQFTRKKYGADTHFIYSYLKCINDVKFIDSIVYIVNSVENSISNRIVVDSWKEMVELYELGVEVINNECKKSKYLLLLRSIKTSLFLEYKISYSSFKKTCNLINQYLLQNNLNKLKREGNKYDNYIYFMITHKLYIFIYAILIFRNYIRK
ncbi:glycosyltransferase family 2 protein [Candidatus Stoquefichus massiliensis]|uniref:glycosyltransferase family 2 protein n=1 Tax=Candidatus Stoquefichus massiliensis TaxID=1470350 RepID=UPI0004B60693|nr:glycosyltransferase family 2 protein [Candidatus Stoquefichus massiliensis]